MINLRPVEKICRSRRKTSKCTQCRTDKKKCEPVTGSTDGKCERCVDLDHECSERLTAEQDVSYHHHSRHKRRRKSVLTNVNPTIIEEEVPRPEAEAANSCHLQRHDSHSSNTTNSTHIIRQAPRSPGSSMYNSMTDSFMSITPPEPEFPSGLASPGSLEGALHQHNQNGRGSFSQELNGALHFLLRDVEGNQNVNGGNMAQAPPDISLVEPTGSADTPSFILGCDLESLTASDANLEDVKVRRESKLWQNFQLREAVYKDTSSALAPLLATLRESRAKTRDHMHKPSNLKPWDCPTCKLLLTFGRTRQIKSHVNTLLETAKAALEDGAHTQAELLFLKAQSAMMEYTDGSFDDEETTAITLKLIKLYQDRNSALEAELCIEILAKRTRDTKSLTKTNAKAMLLESLRKTTSEVCKPIENYDLHDANPEAEDSVMAVPFTLSWRALCRNVQLRLDDVDMNTRDSYGNTALHDYIKRCDFTSVVQLVHAGANLMARNKDQQTPLEIACIYGSLDIVQFLVQFVETYVRGISIATILETHVYGASSTPLHAAIEHRWPDIVCYLLSKGAGSDKIRNLPDGQAPMGQKMMTPIELAAYMAKQPGQSANEKDNSEKILNILLAQTQNKYLTDVDQVSFLDPETIEEESNEPLFGGQYIYGYEPVIVRNVEPIEAPNVGD